MTLESKTDITNGTEPAREEELLAGKVKHTPVRKTHRKLKIVLMAVLTVIVAGAMGFGAYVGDYYHADDAALAAMEPTGTVAVQRLEDGDIAFVLGDPAGRDRVLPRRQGAGRGVRARSCRTWPSAGSSA